MSDDVKPYTRGEFPIRANAEQIRLHHDDDCMAPVGRDCTCHVAPDREMIRRLYETALVGLNAAAAVERGVRETTVTDDDVDHAVAAMRHEFGSVAMVSEEEAVRVALRADRQRCAALSGTPELSVRTFADWLLAHRRLGLVPSLDRGLVDTAVGDFLEERKDESDTARSGRRDGDSA